MQGTTKPLLIIGALVIIALGWRSYEVRTPSTPSDTVPTDKILDNAADETGDDTDNSMEWTYQGALPAEQIENKQVRITTEFGDVVLGLYPDTAPLAVSNFIYLASNGYYDNVIFHRVIETFMIQGGDPTGTGSGGPGYKFPDELEDDRTYTRGTVAMANAGPNTNGSQFFIMHQDYPLPHDYTIFGYVISGMDVVDKIATTETGRFDRPVTDIVMTKVTVEDAQ